MLDMILMMMTNQNESFYKSHSPSSSVENDDISIEFYKTNIDKLIIDLRRLRGVYPRSCIFTSAMEVLVDEVFYHPYELPIRNYIRKRVMQK